METKYEATFTEDNEVVFKLDTKLEEKDNPLEIRLTPQELEYLQAVILSTYQRASMNKVIHGLKIDIALESIYRKIESRCKVCL